MTAILVVDDSRLIRDMISFALDEAGLGEITQAVDGADALAKSETRIYDLIVTDINMPNMNGLELTEALRARQAYKKTPIVVLTTEASSAMREQGKRAGASAWLIKPFVPEELFYVIETLLMRSR